MFKCDVKIIPFALIMLCLMLAVTQCTLSMPESTSTDNPTLITPSLSGFDDNTATTPASTITVENAAQLQQLTRLGKGAIQAIALAPDGRLLAVGSTVGVYLYDIETLEGSQLEVDTFVYDIAFDPSGNLLAVAGSSLLQIWDISTGQLAHTLDHGGPFFSLAFDDDGKRLASGGEYAVQIWDVESGMILQELHAGNENVLTVDFSPDGMQLVSGGGETNSSYTLQVWDLKTGQIVYNLDDQQWVRQATFSPDGRWVASVSLSRIELLDIRTGTFMHEIQISSGMPLRSTSDGFVFSADGETLVSDGWPIRCWNIKGELLHTFEAEADNVLFHPDGQRIISQLDSTFRIWELSTGQIVREFVLPEHIGWIYDLAFSPDGSVLATVSADDILRLWDVETGELQIFHKADYDLWLVAFHPGGEILAYGGCSAFYWKNGECVEGEVTLWDIKSRQIIGDFNHSILGAIAFNPNGQTIAASTESWYGLIRLFDIHSGAIWDIDRGCEAFGSPLFSPDGRTMYVYCANSSYNGVQLLNTENGELIREFNDSYSVGAISPDGRLLASTTWQSNRIQIWDVFGDSNDVPLVELETQGESVLRTAFGVDGKLLAAKVEVGSRGSDTWSSWLELWDAVSGRLLLTIDTEFLDMSLSPDGKYLATGDSDSSVRLWGINPD
jgi:WD40 repeat protein